VEIIPGVLPWLRAQGEANWGLGFSGFTTTRKEKKGKEEREQ